MSVKNSPYVTIGGVKFDSSEIVFTHGSVYVLRRYEGPGICHSCDLFDYCSPRASMNVLCWHDNSIWWNFQKVDKDTLVKILHARGLDLT